jgi:anti-sigma regulatory factor (Ser/Thr protein kinase)
MGHWTPAIGRLHLLNAGLPHGIHSSLRSGCRRIEINGTPLGIFDEPMLDEKVLVLEAGDRLLFGSDGVFDAKDKEGRVFDEICTKAWSGTSNMEVAEAVTTMASLAQSMAEGGLGDDLLLVGFAQPAVAPVGLRINIPAKAEAIDKVVAKLEGFLANPPRSIPLTQSRRFDILTAAREALTNALYHGNQGDPEKGIWLLTRWQEHPPALLLAVVDEGKGFDLAALAPPSDTLSERGRGIPFLRRCAGRVQMAGGELSLEFRWED